MKKGNDDAARQLFRTGQKLGEGVYEPYYNGALLAYRVGDFGDSYRLAQAALGAAPGHVDTQELLKQLKGHFTTL